MQPLAAPYGETRLLPQSLPRRHRAVRALVIALAAPIALAGNHAAAQQANPEAPRPAAYIRSTTSFSYFHPLDSGSLARGYLNVRLGEDWGLTPAFGLRASLLQIGGAEEVLMGASLGARWSHMFGPIRVSPGAEFVVGQAAVEAGAWYFDPSTGLMTHYTELHSAGTWGRGAGLLGIGEWFHRSGLGVGLSIGYWRFFAPKPGSALMLGLGIRLGRRDPSWYWRTSGKDDTPPHVRVISPTVASDGTRQLRVEGVRLIAADPSGIRSVMLDGEPMYVVPAKDSVVAASGGHGSGVDASLRPPIQRGAYPLHIKVTDGAGHQTTQVVVASVPDPDPPTTVLTDPRADARVEAPYVDVAGTTTSFAAGMRVGINGCLAVTNPTNVREGRPGRAFKLRAGLKPGDNVIEVETRDPHAGRSVLRWHVTHVPAAGDPAPHGPPLLALSAAPSVSGRAVRVSGTASDTAGFGIDAVLVAGVPANLQFTADDRSRADFVAYAAPGADIDVRATTLDGRAAEARPAAAAGAGKAPSGAALLIGLESYAADYVAGPATAAATAAAMADLLRTHGAVEFGNRTRVLTDGHATAHDIRFAMRWLAQAARDADVVYVYVGGHGIRGASGEAIGLVPYDVRNTYGSGAMPWAEFETLFQSLAAEVVAIVELRDDAGNTLPPPAGANCGAGAAPEGGLAILSAGGPADGSFSRRVLDVLLGDGAPAGSTVRLSDLLQGLGTSGKPPALRTVGPLFDPALPLTTTPDQPASSDHAPDRP